MVEAPARPVLATSAAIIRDGRILIVRRARPPAAGVYTLPGGKVEFGETLHEAVIREVREECAIEIAPVGLAGYRDGVGRKPDGQVEYHYVILCFAARWISGEPHLNHELSEAAWRLPSELSGLKTTAGLKEIITAAYEVMERHG